MKNADVVAGQLKGIAQKQEKATRSIRNKPRPVQPSEQMRRFLSGDERVRLERGEITPAQWMKYQQTMLRRLGLEG